ncbi:siderophore-interacting protein [Phycobacter sp. K97]|uniref:siderophore-interacting protein n=1 Tax=Phycobacter sedimenti TaxID=3133977 RepID=UPI00311D544A
MTELTGHSDLPGVAFAPLCQMARAEAVEHGLEILHGTEAKLTVQTHYGRLSFSPMQGGTRAEIRAPHADFLQTLKDPLVDQISSVFPESAQQIRWSDAASAGQLPDNAWVMSVAHVSALAGGFRRVTLKGDVSRFSQAAIHFRLGLPPEGRAAEWPTIGVTGATQWPKGDAKLHLPVYTARDVRPDAGELIFDLFQHDGGRATRWAETVPAGTEILVTGPGGGGCKIDSPIRAFADDTGFPAVARILEANPDLTGRISLYPSSAYGAAYPLPRHGGVEVVWEPPFARDTMAGGAVSAITAHGESFLWFAGEKRLAAEVRAAWKQSGRVAQEAYISAYWQR